MKIIKERPTTGQYLVVWEFDGRIWSDTMQVVNGEHLEYHQESDSFKPVYGRLCESIPLHYVVLHVPFSMSDEPDLGDEFKCTYKSKWLETAKHRFEPSTLPFGGFPSCELIDRADQAWQNAVEAHGHCQAANQRAEALLDKIEAKVYTQRQMDAAIQKHIAERQKLQEEIESLRTAWENADKLIIGMLTREQYRD